ncbi:MAG: M28 family peptidase, partial [Candidatus Heimdallarchaeota archaeon]|nr:M28 family peptidase [Candidatus Heimdallarchaeota archaeon]MCK4877885.1 M28 family peptidase [Candidatus Heimdallarchaeota archaeon]
SQLDFGFRVPGTTAHNNCADWISDQIDSYVDEASVHHFSIQVGSQPRYYCQNILGKINTNKNNIVILGTHWDSRNVAEKDSYNQSQPIPGANDGGSGVGVLIELARVLSLYKDNLDCQIWFLFIDAEDQGYSLGMYGLEYWDWCEGSREFVDDIDEFYDSSSENFESFILLDMVGGTDLQFIREANSDQILHNRIFRVGQKLGYDSAFPDNPTVMSIIDDHIAFKDIGITVIDLIIDFVNGEWEYHHTHLDNLDNIDPESLKTIGQTVESYLKTYYTVGFPMWAYFVIIISGILVITPLVFFIRKRR